MGKIKERITILAIGDRADHDSFRKLHREKTFILQCGFDYVSISYRRFLASNTPPPIKTRKVIIFLFFPFVYWNRYIEHNGYKGIYGNRTFFKKFMNFWDRVDKIIKSSLKDKEVSFVNSPLLCGLYRDKLIVGKKFSWAGVPKPRLYNISHVKKIESLLNKGHTFFLKPRYGSMGKGITFLSWSNWQTNFAYRNNRIISRRSDHGWKFRDITGNKRFLGKLIKKDILIEKAIDSLTLKRMKVDMRVYVFFSKVIYVYPRKNRIDRITTNISQGAKGDPSILRRLPRHLVDKAKELVSNLSEAMGLNLAGMDVMFDHNLKDVYVLDVNAFPGFPKRKTFNIAQCMIKELVKLRNKGRIVWNFPNK